MQALKIICQKLGADDAGLYAISVQAISYTNCVTRYYYYTDRFRIII